jgi:hypothetical protein
MKLWHTTDCTLYFRDVIVLTLESVLQMTFYIVQCMGYSIDHTVCFQQFSSNPLSCWTRIVSARSLQHFRLSVFIPSEIFCADNHDIRVVAFISLLYSGILIYHFSREWRKQTNMGKRLIRKTTFFKKKKSYIVFCFVVEFCLNWKYDFLRLKMFSRSASVTLCA